MANAPLELRWGIISTGKIATSFVKDILIDPKTRDVHDVVHKVVAVGSRSVETAQKFIKDVTVGDPCIRAYGTYEGVYEDDNVDAVYIGTPHTFHYSNAHAALLSKKHVLVEKPVTCNAAELRSLIDTAKAQGVFFIEAMWTRFLPVAKEFEKVVAEGKLGKPVMMWGSFLVDFDIDHIPKTHRALDPMLGGGGLLDLGPYPLVWAIMALYEHPSNNLSRPSHLTGSMVKTPLTGVDVTTSFTVTFDPSRKKEKEVDMFIAAQAILSTNITLSSLPGPVVIIRYQHGIISIPAPIFAPKEFTVSYYSANTIDANIESDEVKEVRNIKVDWVGGGWYFEADEVARCVKDGRLESKVWGWDKSLLEMEVFDEVRKQGGYRFPPGVEKVV